jgi:hypothetical protein
MIVRTMVSFWMALLLGTGISASVFAADIVPIPTGYSVRSDGDDRLYRINLGTGAATQLGLSGFPKLEGLAMNAAGDLYAVNPSTTSAQSQLVKCATDTGVCSAVGVLGVVTISGTNAGLAFTPAGQLYLALNASIYVVNPATGATAFIGSNGTAISGLAATAPTTNCASGLFGIGGNSNAGTLYCVSTVNGSVISLGRVGTAPTDAGLDADPSTGLLWEITNPTDAAAPAQIFSFSPVTLTQSTPVNVTLDGTPIGGFEGLAVRAGIAATQPPVLPAADEPIRVPTLSQRSLLFSALSILLIGVVAVRRRRVLALVRK